MQLKKKHIIIFSSVILLFVGLLFLPNLGHLLIAEDVSHESDIIVVLMGSVPDRILETVDVYNEGIAEKVLIVNSHMEGYDILLEKGVDIPGHAQLSKMVAVKLGIPDENIIILEGAARSTQDEAIIIRDYIMKNKGISSIILVTSKYHSARSKKIFEKAFGSIDRDVEITSCPSRYDTFNADQWWKDREDGKKVVLECLKFLNFYLWEQFQL